MSAPAASSPLPLPLAYDNLPPGSDVRREDLDGGGLKITVPAGDVPPAVAKETLAAAFLSAAAIGAPLLVLSLLLFLLGVRNNRIGGVYLAWAWAFFAIFCSFLVLLIAWLRYGMMTDSIRAGRQQMTVLAATSRRLLIETAGPFGVASYDLAPQRLGSLDIRRAAMQDERGVLRRVTHLALTTDDGRTILLLPGRDARELTWIRSAVIRTVSHEHTNPPT